MESSLASFLEAMPKKDKFIFLSQKGTQLGRYQVEGTIESLQKKYRGMKGWRCHDLRNSFAYNYLKRVGEMYALKAILGHKSIQLTVDLYRSLPRLRRQYDRSL